MALEHTNFVMVGAGGLGCPALLGLSAAGARRITIVDPDVVETSNLQRQVLYGSADVGLPKARLAALALSARDPALDVDPRVERLDPEQASAFVADLPAGSLVLDGTDSPRLKFALNDACLARDVPLVIGGAIGFRGQALGIRRGRACYRCLYEAPPPPQAVGACDTAGVLGAAVGALGYLMAHLAVRLAGPEPQAVAGTLHVLDLLAGTTRTLSPRARTDCAACGHLTPNPLPRASGLGSS